MNLKKIFANNKKWRKEKMEHSPLFFEKLSKGQNPEILYIGCSDSRVSTEEMMGMAPGEVFVHRNIANMVISIDASASSVIQYAVEHLQVKHIIVCGHYGCNGVKSSLQAADLGILNPWLRNIRDVYRLHHIELDALQGEEKYNRLVELNVQEQCVNVLKTAVVQKAIHKRGLTVHGWIFDVHTGKLIDLKIDFPVILEHIEEIYRLTD